MIDITKFSIKKKFTREQDEVDLNIKTFVYTTDFLYTKGDCNCEDYNSFKNKHEFILLDMLLLNNLKSHLQNHFKVV